MAARQYRAPRGDHATRGPLDHRRNHDPSPAEGAPCLGYPRRRFRHGSEDRTWRLPSGEDAQQDGTRQTDLLLVWADDSQPLDETRIHALWPQSGEVQSLGPRLFLVWGVDVSPVESPAGTPLPADSSPQQAEQWLADARRNGDRAEEASALADLGLLALDQGEVPLAVAHLEEALARALGDQAREGDVLGILGLIVFKGGQPEQARQYLEQALILARATGDHFAEKLTLERLVTVQALRGDMPAALGLLDDALALARSLGDRQHEADLLWHLAILQAESGQAEQAISYGQQAVEMLRTLGRPQARVYTEHLQKYRHGGAQPTQGTVPIFVAGRHKNGTVPFGAPVDTKIGTGPDPAAAVTTMTGQGLSEVATPPKHTDPSYLRMAISAAQALTQFVGSGLKTVTGETLQARLRQCDGCSYSTGLRCRVCGCFANLKARLPHEDCPLGQWPALDSQKTG